MTDRLDDIIRVLGRLEEGQENAKESRKVIYEKMENLADTLGDTNNALRDTNFALRVTTEIATQTRDKFDAFKRKFDEEATPLLEGVSTFQTDAAPLLEQIKKARAAVMILVWILGVGGVSTVGVLALANDYAKAVVREWLDIDPPTNSIPPIN